MSESEQALSFTDCASAELAPAQSTWQTEPLHPELIIYTSSSKRLFDVGFALLLFVLSLPLFLLIMAVLLCCRGPVLYKHQRIGVGGHPFQCLKFRTMVPNGDHVLATTLARNPLARAEWDTKRKLINDPRVTRIGRLLRKTSLDELPQLINVLKGDMSLVGPRPIIQEEEAKYGDDLIYYVAVRPGITGLWQVSGRSNTSFEHRVALDRSYVADWSLMNDLLILLRTIPALLAREGAY